MIRLIPIEEIGCVLGKVLVPISMRAGTGLKTYLDLYNLPQREDNETWHDYESRLNVSLHFFPVVTRLQGNNDLVQVASEAGALLSECFKIYKVP